LDPNTLYVLLKDMRQAEPNGQPFSGVPDSEEAYVVAYEGPDYGRYLRAVKEAMSWMDTGGSYRPGDEGTLLEIRVVQSFRKGDDGVVSSLGVWGTHANSNPEVYVPTEDIPARDEYSRCCSGCSCA